MRISVVREDPGYSSNARMFNIFLDNVKQRDVLTADEEFKFVFRLKRTKFGNIAIGRNNKKMTELVKGEVRIVLRDTNKLEGENNAN